jgi:CheY-like chemotaxis protein
VNTRIVLLGTQQDFFLELLEMLVPGGARDSALELEEHNGVAPLPEAAPFEVWFAYCGTDGLDEIRRLRRVGAHPAVAMVDMSQDPEDALEIAGRLLADDPRLQVVMVAPNSDEDWDARADLLGHRDQVVLLKRPFDAVEVRELAHVLVQRWDELDSVLARIGRVMPGHTVAVSSAVPTLTPASGVEVMRDAFRAIHGLVTALTARCETLEPGARSEALQTISAVTHAVDELCRAERLDESREPGKPPAVGNG